MSNLTNAEQKVRDTMRNSGFSDKEIINVLNEARNGIKQQKPSQRAQEAPQETFDTTGGVGKEGFVKTSPKPSEGVNIPETPKKQGEKGFFGRVVDRASSNMDEFGNTLASNKGDITGGESLLKGARGASALGAAALSPLSELGSTVGGAIAGAANKGAMNIAAGAESLLTDKTFEEAMKGQEGVQELFKEVGAENVKKVIDFYKTLPNAAKDALGILGNASEITEGLGVKSVLKKPIKAAYEKFVEASPDSMRDRINNLSQSILDASGEAVDSVSRRGDFLPSAKDLAGILTKKVKGVKDLNNVVAGIQDSMIDKVNNAFVELSKLNLKFKQSGRNDISGSRFSKGVNSRAVPEDKLVMDNGVEVINTGKQAKAGATFEGTDTVDKLPILSADDILAPAMEELKATKNTLGSSATNAAKTMKKIIDAVKKDLGDGILLGAGQNHKKNLGKFLRTFFDKQSAVSTLDEPSNRAFNAIRRGLQKSLEKKADDISPGAGKQIADLNSAWGSLQEARGYLAPMITKINKSVPPGVIGTLLGGATNFLAGAIVSTKFGRFSGLNKILSEVLKKTPDLRTRIYTKEILSLKKKESNKLSKQKNLSKDQQERLQRQDFLEGEANEVVKKKKLKRKENN